MSSEPWLLMTAPTQCARRVLICLIDSNAPEENFILFVSLPQGSASAKFHWFAILLQAVLHVLKRPSLQCFKGIVRVNLLEAGREALPQYVSALAAVTLQIGIMVSRIFFIFYSFLVVWLSLFQLQDD